MNHNEGSADRIIRVVLAAAAIVAAFALGASSVVGIVLFVVAGVLLVTAATGFCPLYRVLGVSTCRVPAQR
jgi:phosphate/sulfate permease